MNITDAVSLNGQWVSLMVNLWGEDMTLTGQVVGVVVPALGLGVDAHLLLRQDGESVAPCGGGLEVFLGDIVALLWWGDAPVQQKGPPVLRVV